MIGSIGAQVALLAFAVAILAGLGAGNSPVTVLSRALVAMVVALLVGQAVSWVGRIVLRDHLQRKKQAIDRAHAEALGARQTADDVAEKDEDSGRTLEPANVG